MRHTPLPKAPRKFRKNPPFYPLYPPEVDELGHVWCRCMYVSIALIELETSLDGFDLFYLFAVTMPITLRYW